MELHAISDLHLEHRLNREAFAAMEPRPQDWLILAGDVCEDARIFAWGMAQMASKWAKVIWVPGNHELYTLPKRGDGARGETKYRRLVQTCRDQGVVSPEDEFPKWPGDGPATRIVPLFLLYDYSFAPDGLDPEGAKAWAAEHNIVCTDEFLLHPDPHASREAWCWYRCDLSEKRIAAIPRDERLVLVNHFPMHRDVVRLPRIPRFSPWCGTRRTEPWLTRFNVHSVVSGHLHVPRTDHVQGVRFEEVSLGYPRDWQHRGTFESRLRRIL